MELAGLTGTDQESFSIGIGVLKVELKTINGVLYFRTYGSGWRELETIERFEQLIVNDGDYSLGLGSGSYEIFQKDAPKLHVDVYFTAGNGTPHVEFPGGELVTTTKDTASNFNVYVETSELKIQNKLGSDRTFVIFRKV